MGDVVAAAHSISGGGAKREVCRAIAAWNAARLSIRPPALRWPACTRRIAGSIARALVEGERAWPRRPSAARPDRPARRRARAWHLSVRLIIPPNITLVPLPAKCPQLNPQENVWQFMRHNWLEPRFRRLRPNRRPLLRPMEQAHRSALAHHVHWNAVLGLPVPNQRVWVLVRHRNADQPAMKPVALSACCRRRGWLLSWCERARVLVEPGASEAPPIASRTARFGSAISAGAIIPH